MISISKLCKDYGKKRVLDSINLNLETGKTHVILGTSGCGKSTLLRVLLGLIPYDSGKVQFDELEVSPTHQQEIASQVGYVVQEGGLFPHLTCEQNITLMARYRGWPLDRQQSRVKELAGLVNLGESLIKRFPKELSGGQRQRVALMRALMLDPKTLFLDEPLGALDPIIRKELQGELRTIFNRLKKTVLMVTHDLSEAAYFGSTITLMHAGKVVQHGDFQNLVEQPAEQYVTTFLNAQRPIKELMQ